MSTKNAAQETAPGLDVVGDYMTPNPMVIDKDQALTEAAALMRQRGIRHLPVTTTGGKCIGIVSDRDIHRARAMPPQATPLTVGDAMTPDPVTFTRDTLLHDVALKMAGYRCGSCIIVERGEVIGIFTTIDALKVLAEMLRRLNGGRAPTATTAAPSTRPAARVRGV